MINRVLLTGRLVREAEIRKTSTNSIVATFTVAVDNFSKNGDKSAIFIPCTAWNATAEYVDKYVRKGNLVGIEGRINQRTYTGRDGRIMNVVEVVCEKLDLLQSRTTNYNDSTTDNGELFADDTPF